MPCCWPQWPYDLSCGLHACACMRAHGCSSVLIAWPQAFPFYHSHCLQVYVSVKELLPSAFRFDPTDKVVSTSECEH